MPTWLDQHFTTNVARGRIGWRKMSGYSWRTLVESDMEHFKWVIDTTLRSHTMSAVRPKWQLPPAHAQAPTPGVCPHRLIVDSLTAQCT